MGIEALGHCCPIGHASGADDPMGQYEPGGQANCVAFHAPPVQYEPPWRGWGW